MYYASHSAASSYHLSGDDIRLVTIRNYLNNRKFLYQMLLQSRQEEETVLQNETALTSILPNAELA